jgi:hypothetical protein
MLSRSSVPTFGTTYRPHLKGEEVQEFVKKSRFCASASSHESRMYARSVVANPIICVANVAQQLCLRADKNVIMYNCEVVCIAV